MGRGPCGPIPGLKSDEVVLVVGGAGRVGRRLVSTLVNCGVRVRVMTRDADSVAARELASKFSDATSSALLEIVEGDVTDDDDARIERAVAGCTRVVACHGAERIARVADLFYDASAVDLLDHLKRRRQTIQGPESEAASSDDDDHPDQWDM